LPIPRGHEQNDGDGRTCLMPPIDDLSKIVFAHKHTHDRDGSFG